MKSREKIIIKKGFMFVAFRVLYRLFKLETMLKNQFEFLSVILEHFFETPRVFKSYHPELYAHVAAMINFDEPF